MIEWSDRIRQWASDRNLIKGSTPSAQITKLNEEVDELVIALAAENFEEIVDAIGDIQVVLGVMCAQLGLNIDACRETAWEVIKDRKGRMIDGVFVKENQNEVNT